MELLNLIKELKEIYAKYGNLSITIFQVSEKPLDKVRVCKDDEGFLIVELNSE